MVSLFSAKIQSDDPICSLDKFQRLRVCTLVLSSNYFEGELTFVPTLESIDESDCFKVRISFQNEDAKFKANGKVYEEWTIGCRPDEYYADYQKEYLVSRVYKANNEVFVYRYDDDDDHKIILENRFGNMRFKI